MPTLNQNQSHLIGYIDQYQSLVKEIGNCLDDYQAGYGYGRILKADGTESPFVLHIVTKEERDWLNYNFYPLLKRDLHNHIPSEQAKDVLNEISKADEVLFALSDKTGYQKYSDTAVFSQDIRTLMGAIIATEKILDVVIPGRTSKKQEVPILSEDEADMLNWYCEEYPLKRPVTAYPKRDNKTKYIIAHRLEKLKLLERPENDTRGYTITDEGRQYIEDYFMPKS